MRLSTRLLLLVCLALLPMLGVALYTEAELRLDRRAELAYRARQEAELWNGTLTQLVDATHDVAIAATRIPLLREAGPGCDRLLAEVHAGFPRYRFLAITDESGAILCSDAVCLRLPSGGGARRYLVAALDLRWLSSELEPLLSCCDGHGGQKLMLVIADRRGIILYRSVDPESRIGKQIGPSVLPLVNASTTGTATVTGRDGQQRIVGYVPTKVAPYGLFVASGFYAGDATADVDEAMWQGGLLLAAGAAIAFAIAWLSGQRWIGQPARLLLQTAERWRGGDLSARAPVSDIGTEFGHLATTFNELVAALKTREDEQMGHALLLEERVQDRTRALSETNNRLQVEIIERERTEVALQRAQKLQAVGQLAGGVAHEFNNMLATVLGNLELLERRLPADDPRLKPWVERAIAAVRRGSQLTSRLLAFSRRQRLSTGPIDLNVLAADLSTLAVSALGPRVEVVTSLAPGLWLALADRSQLEAAILNLAFNAREAMLEGGGTVTISTANEVLSAGNFDDLDAGQYVRVSVSDTGIGMSPEIAARAIEPFFTTKGPGWSGLGLSQVYGMARQSGGTLRLVSNPGLGTTVSLLLPRAIPQTEVSGNAAAGLASQIECSVLIVDDDADVRLATASMLVELGYQVAEVPGGVEALAFLSEEAANWDVVLADYAMPLMNGLELTAAIRARGFAHPIILAIGYAEFSDPGGAETMLTAILRKPFTLRELRDTITEACRRSPNDTNCAPSGQSADIGLG